MPKQKAKFEKLDPSKWFNEETSAHQQEYPLEHRHDRGTAQSTTKGGTRTRAEHGYESTSINHSSSTGEKGQIVEAGVKSTMDLRTPSNINCDVRTWRTGGSGQRIVLMVAEKPSIAKTLSTVLANGTEVWKRHGTSPFSPVHEYEGSFRGVSCLFRVTSVCGHVFGTNFPEEWNNWHAHEPRELFEAPTVKEEAEPKAKMLGHLRAEAKGASALLLWLDCDREGENICYEVIGLAEERMSAPRLVLRAQFSSLNPRDLWYAYENLGRPEPRLSEAVEARMVVDLKLGVSFTRFLTLFVRKEFKSLADALDLKVLSYGPCQVPALWFVVKRHDEALTFVPKPFWELFADLGNSSSSSISFKRADGPYWTEKEVAAIKSKLGKVKIATITKVSRKAAVRMRPLSLNTVKMLQKASTHLRIGAHQALSIAENLYISGLITYPRTETTRHAASFDPTETLNELAQLEGRLGTAAARLARGSGFEGPRNDGFDAGDHPPITPIRVPTASDRLDNRQWKLYEMIACHFLQTLATDFRAEEITATADIAGEDFVVTATKVLDRGWTELDGHGDHREDTRVAALANMKEGMQLSVWSTRSVRKETQAPPLLTESDLLGLMERFGVGTDATMATHIETIVKRGYVTLDEQSRDLWPLPLGRALIHGLVIVDEDLCSPIVRASIEADVSEVARGKAPREHVERRALRLFTKKFEQFTTQASVILLMLAADHAHEKHQRIPSIANDIWSDATQRLAAVNLDTLKPTAIATKTAAAAAAAQAAAETAATAQLPQVAQVVEALAEVGLCHASTFERSWESATGGWQAGSTVRKSNEHGKGKGKYKYSDRGAPPWSSNSWNTGSSWEEGAYGGWEDYVGGQASSSAGNGSVANRWMHDDGGNGHDDWAPSQSGDAGWQPSLRAVPVDKSRKASYHQESSKTSYYASAASTRTNRWNSNR